MNDIEKNRLQVFNDKYDLIPEMLEVKEKLKDDNLTDEERESYEVALWRTQCLIEVNEDLDRKLKATVKKYKEIGAWAGMEQEIISNAIKRYSFCNEYVDVVVADEFSIDIERVREIKCQIEN